jgi:hypothetical protein
LALSFKIPPKIALATTTPEGYNEEKISGGSFE